MIRITKSGNQFYGIEIEQIDEEEAENIKFFSEESFVIIVDDLKKLEFFNISPEDIKMV